MCGFNKEFLYVLYLIQRYSIHFIYSYTCYKIYVVIPGFNKTAYYNIEIYTKIYCTIFYNIWHIYIYYMILNIYIYIWLP